MAPVSGCAPCRAVTCCAFAYLFSVSSHVNNKSPRFISAPLLSPFVYSLKTESWGCLPSFHKFYIATNWELLSFAFATKTRPAFITAAPLLALVTP